MSIDIVDFIARNRTHLDAIIDLIPIPIFMKDKDAKYIDCNIAFTRFLAYSREQLMGKSVFDIWSQQEAEVFYQQDQALLKAGGTQVYETRITSASGIVNYVQFHKRVFTNSDGEPLGFIGVIFDITEKKLHIEELEVALGRVKQLEGILPICAWCKRMREADQTWIPLEEYISCRTTASFSHSICPDCASKWK